MFFVATKVSLAIDDFSDVGVRRFHVFSYDRGDFFDSLLVVSVLT